MFRVLVAKKVVKCWSVEVLKINHRFICVLIATVLTFSC